MAEEPTNNGEPGKSPPPINGAGQKADTGESGASPEETARPEKDKGTENSKTGNPESGGGESTPPVGTTTAKNRKKINHLSLPEIVTRLAEVRKQTGGDSRYIQHLEARRIYLEQKKENK